MVKTKYNKATKAKLQQIMIQNSIMQLNAAYFCLNKLHIIVTNTHTHTHTHKFTKKCKI